MFDDPTLAARHWVVSSGELFAAGFTQDEVDHRVARGVLHRVHRGVFAVGRPCLEFEGWCRAAILASGEGSAISHITGAALHDFRRGLGRIHVSAPRSVKGHPGLIVHRPRSLPLADIVERKGVAVTSVARTLLDMSPNQPVERIGGWIHEAQVQRVFDQRETWEVLERHPHHRGRRRLEAALALEVAPTRSGLEDAFLAVARAARLPRPLVNSHQSSGERLEEVDCCWPTIGLIVEVDSLRYHSSRWRRRRDEEKAARLRAQGWTVWRVPELAITLDPAGTARHLATLGLPDRPDSRVRSPTA